MKEFFDDAGLAGLEGSEFGTLGRLSIAGVSCRKQLDSAIPDIDSVSISPDFWSSCAVSTFRGRFEGFEETEIGENRGIVDSGVVKLKL
jgi:hypothetical protein